MNNRLAIWISVALNPVLLVAILLAAKSRSTPAPTSTSPAAPVTAVQLPVVEQVSTNSAPAPADKPFLWSQIAAEDLKVYRDHLRAIDCPSSTIRDIILAEINARFNRRWKELLGPLHSRFWELAPRGARSVERAFADPLYAIENERTAVINEVLGGGPYISRGIESVSNYAEQRCACLPPEKRQRYLLLEEAHRRRMQQWSAGIDWEKNHRTMTPEDQTQLQAIQQEFDEQLGQLLSPEEIHTIQLTDSSAAYWAKNLTGFEPSEEEWRKVVELQRESNQPHPVVSDRTAAQLEAFRQEELIQQAIKAALSPERYAQYELAKNSDYQQTRNIVQRYGLADAVAAQVVDVQQSAIAAADQVRADPSLSSEQRQAALDGIQQETMRTLSGTLGDQPLATYEEYAGSWIEKLARQQ